MRDIAEEILSKDKRMREHNKYKRQINLTAQVML